jgi:hypothetical protein
VALPVRALAALAIGAAALFGLPAPDSAAIPGTCEHRGGDHIGRHGGKLEDDRFHLSRGERVTCDGDTDHKDSQPGERHEKSAPVPGHRDHPGFHCHHLRCG